MDKKTSLAEDENTLKLQQKRMRQNTLIILISILFMSLLSIYVLRNSISPYSRIQQSNGVNGKVRPVELIALQQMANSQTKEFDNDAKAGDIFEFQLASTQSIYVALIGSINGQTPVAFYKGARIPPGPHRHLEKAGVLFTYEVQASDNSIVFCILQAKSQEALYTSLRSLHTLWASIPSQSCVQLK